MDIPLRLSPSLFPLKSDPQETSSRGQPHPTANKRKACLQRGGFKGRRSLTLIFNLLTLSNSSPGCLEFGKIIIITTTTTWVYPGKYVFSCPALQEISWISCVLNLFIYLCLTHQNSVAQESLDLSRCSIKINVFFAFGND